MPDHSYKVQGRLDKELAASNQWRVLLTDSQLFPYPPSEWATQRQWRIYERK